MLAVLGFHVIPWRFPGGYIGVDIFFVISGFLITRILWRDLEEQKFSLSNFYAKRIRRLFPALLFLLAVCGLLILFVGLPNEISTYGMGAIAAAFYVSNHYFLSRSDYFDEGLESDPLLHTWSLSVEEQFYLVFPLLLLLIFRVNKKHAGIWLFVVAALSLLLSELLLEEHRSTSFFIAPSRFWQFLAGSMLAIMPLKSKLPSALMDVLNLVGLSALLWGIWAFSDQTLFPGFSALLPTLGTVLVIFAGQQEGLITFRLLANPVTRFFSNISYSLYLWHWPLIVFYKLQLVPQPASEDRYLLIALSIVLGYLSWRFVERPFRHIELKNRARSVITAGAVASALVAIFGAALVFSEGGKQRFTDEQLSYLEYLSYDADPFYRTDECFMTSRTEGVRDFRRDICVNFNVEKPNVLIVGDSHSAQYVAAFKESIDAVEFSQVNASGCRPLVSYKGEKRCTEMTRLAFEDIANQYKFDAIIIAGRWESEDMDAIHETVNYLSQKTTNVIVLGPIIEYRQALPRLLVRYGGDEDALKNARTYKRIEALDHRMRSLLELSSTEYYSILQTMCTGNDCLLFSKDGSPIQFDASHLTHTGALDVVKALLQQGFLQKLM